MSKPFASEEERSRALGNEWFKWAMISSSLIIAGMLSYILMDILWVLPVAIAVALILRYFVMFRRFRRQQE